LIVLREHILRRRTLSPSRIDTFWQPKGNANDSWLINILNIHGQAVAYAEGVLARQMINELVVVQLPSLNYGVEMSSWVLDKDIFEFTNHFWILPSFDLLVLMKLKPKFDPGS
jgi:hypothetical protein